MKLYSIIHVILLAYIIAALSFWWHSLEKQSRIIYEQELVALSSSIDNGSPVENFASQKQKIELRKEKRSHQYLGEGLTFLLVIFIGSSVVYSTYRFQNKLSRQQNNFMLSVTHELKSPIAAMKLTLQTLQRHHLDAGKQKELLSRCIIESDRLNELCNNVLVASQMEGGQYQKNGQLQSISSLLSQTSEMYQMRYPKRFQTDIEPNVETDTDAMLLRLAVHNLIENAIKYTPSDMPILLSLKKRNDKILISVADQGNGIAEVEKKKVFQKFYRIGSEDTRQTKGTGLGLYLSAKIMKHLKGDIKLNDNKPNGCVFELIIKA